MSFGFGVRDFLASIQNLKRIAEEVQNYRNAPRHFQQLSAELRLLQNTLQCVLQVQTTDVNELANLERIRQIAMHCQQPLLAFIDKIRPKETSLGHFRTAGTISAIGGRLRWSLITRKDVEDLRKVVVSEMVAINVLLGMQQLTYLRMLAKDDSAFREDARNHFADSKALLTKSVDILNNVETLPSEIRKLQDLVASGTSKYHNSQTEITEGISAISVNTELIVSQSKKALEGVHNIGNQALRTMIAVASLMANINRPIKSLAKFSKEVLRQIAKNTRTLLDIHTKMKQVLRAIDAIPLHLSLDVVRFDDALGESWALPLQACKHWATFKNMLREVVFTNNRPGSARVALEQFIIISVKDSSVLRPATWASTIKPGAHIPQSMVVSKSSQEQVISGVCPFPSCNEPLNDLHSSESGYTCPKCGRWSVMHGRTTNALQRVPFGDVKYPPFRSNQTPRALNVAGLSLPTIKTLDDNINCFRRIHVYHDLNPIQSLEEALALLHQDSKNARALQFIAWYDFPHRDDIYKQPRSFRILGSTVAIIDYLERSLESDPFDSQTWYLLGRAYMEFDELQIALQKFHEAIYRNETFPGYWHSLGVAYYVLDNLRECIACFSNSLRLNPYIPENWYCLGVLYERSVNPPKDALDAYQRYLELQQVPDLVVAGRCDHLRQGCAGETLYRKAPPLPMKNVDLRGKLHLQRSAKHDEDIRIPELVQDASSEGDWSDTDFDEDYFDEDVNFEN